MTITTRLPPPRIDMTGATVATWRVVGPSRPDGSRAVWYCVCERCGGSAELRGQDIRRGRVEQCQRCGA